MQRNSTLSEHAVSSFSPEGEHALRCGGLQPKAETLRKIMQIAAAYRSEDLAGRRACVVLN